MVLSLKASYSIQWVSEAVFLRSKQNLKAADSGQTAAVVECVKYTDCWKMPETLGLIKECNLETCCLGSEDAGYTG
jgi:hypothetical protein